MLTATSLLVLLLALIGISGKTVSGFVLGNDGQVLRTVTGHLYYLNSVSGTPERLSRRHIENADENHKIRLEMRSEGTNFDMNLVHNSVWTKDSRVAVRNGDDLQEMALEINPACFLVGPLTSDNGVASLSYCDGLSGIIHTAGMDYLIQGASSDSSDDIAELQVSIVARKRETEEEDVDDETVEVISSAEEEEIFSNAVKSSAPVVVTQRGAGISAEVGVWLDQNFVDELKKQRIDTVGKATSFMILKWNTIAAIYGNASVVGIPFSIQLKYVEVWFQNPAFYNHVQSDPSMSPHLNTFCAGTVQEKFDHRMLYTHGVGGNVLGLAHIGGICRSDYACSVVRSKTAAVRVEIHEFGHNLGFLHQPQMQPCNKPDGFMGWDDNYVFNDCYRRKLLQVVKHQSSRCLFVTDVKKPILNRKGNNKIIFTNIKKPILNRKGNEKKTN